MTVIMYDVEKGLTEQEQEIVDSNKLHKQASGKLFYADDTNVMAKTAEAVEIVLHKNWNWITQVCAETKPKQVHTHTDERHPQGSF